MKLFLNDEELDFTLENEKILLDVYNAMVELAKKNEAVITEVKVDGRILTQEDFGIYMEKEISQVEKFEFSTVLLAGLFGILAEILPVEGSVFAKIESLSGLLQTGQVSDASKIIQEIMSLMEIILYVFNCCGNFPEKFASENIGDQSFKEFFDGLMGVLPEFLDSFEK